MPPTLASRDTSKVKSSSFVRGFQYAHSAEGSRNNSTHNMSCQRGLDSTSNAIFCRFDSIAPPGATFDSGLIKEGPAEVGPVTTEKNPGELLCPGIQGQQTFLVVVDTVASNFAANSAPGRRNNPLDQENSRPPATSYWRANWNRNPPPAAGSRKSADGRDAINRSASSHDRSTTAVAIGSSESTPHFRRRSRQTGRSRSAAANSSAFTRMPR